MSASKQEAEADPRRKKILDVNADLNLTHWGSVFTSALTT
jgi:hypothetical protein